MTEREATGVALTPELHALARDLLDTGDFGGVDDVVRAGLRLLRERRGDAGAGASAGPAARSAGAKESFLVALGDAVRPMSDPAEIVAATTRALGEHLGAMRVVYSDIDETGETATTEGDWTDGGAMHLPRRLIVADFGAELIAALRTGATLVVPDVRAHPATAGSLPALEAIGVGALVSVPLLKGGRFAANLNVHGREPRDWTALEVEVIEATAERTWDVLARARAVRDLAEREHELQLLTDALPVLISYVDADRRYRFVNRIYEDWFPRRRADILGRPVREVVGEAAYAVVAPHMDRVLAGERFRFEQRMPYADAAHRHIEVEYVPRRDADGRVEGFYALVQDVSARKAAEAALRESEERLRELNATLETRIEERTAERNRIWDMSRDLFAIMGFDGYLKAINPAWEATLGFDEATLLARPFPEQVHPDDLVAAGPVLARLERGEAVTRFEDRLRHADGSWRWIAWTLVPHDDVFYAVGRDVTAEKAREADLAQAQDLLRQSQKMEAVGQLTGGLAHDFSNLLAGISGSLELMAARIAQGRGTEVERYLAAAQASARRAAALTHRLLAFSRRQTLAPRATDVSRLVAGLEELIGRTVGPAIAVEAVAQAGLWPTLVDPHQLENALLNLCLNARDALPAGGRITIATANRRLDERAARERDLAPGEYVALRVSDDGAGMTPEVRDRAFEPFFTTKPLGQGTGLGLSMIYGFARQSGGAARLRSEPGRGTTASLYLPRYHEGAGAQGAAEAAAAGAGAVRVAEDGGAARGRAATVLVIDDEPLVRLLVLDVLGEMGLGTLEAGDGPEGLRLLRAHAVDLLITDVGLPGGLNGRQVADAARAARPGLPVLFMTGYAEAAVLSHGHLDPGMAVLTKPFDLDRLKGRVEAMIATR